MKLVDAIRILKGNTMACWWPNGPYHGKRGTDLAGIAGEVNLLLQGIRARQGISTDEMFFILDGDNPETAIYDELLTAYGVFRSAAYSEPMVTRAAL